MDSSGSMGSSSGGGGEEYDSRVDSVSAFFGMSNPLSHIGSMSNSHHPPPLHPLSPSLPPPPDHHRLHQTSHMFDPLSSYLDPLSTRQQQPQQPYSNMNFDMVWSKNPRSEANCGGFGDGFTTNTQQSLTARPSTEERQDHHHHHGTSSEKFLRTPGLVQRNPKKRSRASRRAPTTVLTTDTTNFRAMVQEFTGIPAPPFSSPFPRTKLDLFGGSSGNSNSSNGGMTSSPLLTSNYLLRPFPHKLQSPLMPPFLTNTTPPSFSNSNILCSSSPTTTNYQQQLNPQNLQIPSLNFQTFPSPKPQQTPLENNLLNDPQLKMGVFEGFGLGHGLQSLVSSSTPKSDLLRSVNDDSQHATHTKVNCSGLNSSSLEFHGDKRQLEINVTRSEGVVESWINCSSDPS